MLISQAVGVFNIFVGLMLVAAFLLYFGGLAGWYARLGVYPGYRDDMVHVMMWGVAVLFVLVLLLAAVHFIQVYQSIAAFLVGLVIFIALVWLVMKAVSAPKEEEDEEH